MLFKAESWVLKIRCVICNKFRMYQAGRYTLVMYMQSIRPYIPKV